MEQQQQVKELLSAWYSAAFTILDVRHVCLKPQEPLLSYRLPANSFLLACRGAATVELDGQPFLTKSFQLLHGVKGSTLNITAAEGLFVYYLILYKAALALPQRKEKKAASSGFDQQFSFEPADPLALFVKAELLGKQWQETGQLAKFQAKSTFFAFVTEVLSQLQEQNVPLSGADLIGKVLRYMHEHYAEPITLNQLAGMLSCSQRHLTRLFKQQTGFSPIDYLVRYRMEKAKELLAATDASLQQIAINVGYPDVYFFSRMFKKISGQSPIRYKEESVKGRARPNNPLWKSRYPIAARRRAGHTVNDDNNHYQFMGDGGFLMKKSTKHATALILLLGLTLLAAACGGTNHSNTGSGNNAAANTSTTQQEQATERVLKDGLGHEVKVPANPQRVLASYLEDHLVTLGVMPVAQWSVGEGSVQQYLQEKLKDIPTIPSELPFETVMSFKPDLIIMDNAEMVQGDKYDKYSEIAPTFTVGNGKNNDWRQELLIVGDVLNKQAEAKQALDDYEQKAKDAKEKLQQAVGAKSAAALWVTAKSVYVVNQNLSSGDVLYNDLGFTVPAVVQEISSSSDANWSTLSLEKLADLGADYLFIVNTKGVSKEELLKDPIWASVPAVKAGQVYEFDKSGSWLYTGAIANGQIIDDVLENVLK